MDQANIEYVKLDMNRSIGNVYANDLPAQRQGEVLHRYVLGLYNVLNAIVERYPDLFDRVFVLEVEEDLMLECVLCSTGMV